MVAFPKSQQQIYSGRIGEILLLKHLTVIFVFTLNIPSNGHLVADKTPCPKSVR